MTRHTYGNRFKQILHVDNMRIPIDKALEFMTVRNSTMPYQESGEHKHIRIFHSISDPYRDGARKGSATSNVGSLLITMVIDDRMDLLRESTYTI